MYKVVLDARFHDKTMLIIHVYIIIAIMMLMVL